MGKKYLYGVDLGSGAVKTTLISTEGEVVATSIREYPTYYPQVSWAEQDPEDWYKALRDNFAEIVSNTGVNPGEIIALAVDAPTHTAVLMDESFNVLCRAILWTDQRSRKQSEKLKQENREKIFELSYHNPDPMWTLPQLIWIKENQPEIWGKTKRILFAKDYLRYRLTGEYVTDWIDAQGAMLLDAGSRKWSQELCGMAGFPVDRLPEIVAPTDIAGRVTASAAKEIGLAEGTIVVAGASDTVMEILAAGAVRTGQSTVKLATAGRICVISDKAYPHPFLVNYYHLIPGRWYPGTGTKSCAASYRWYRDTFGEYEKVLSPDDETDAYKILDKNAAEIPPGAEGLFFHPYLLGELTPYADPYLRGSFTGISTKHSKAHFTRSLLEGVAFSLRDSIEVLYELGMEINDTRIIGGGARSPLWRQIVSDVLGLELQKAETDDSSFGAAMTAGVGVGIFPDFEEAAERCIKIKSTTRPDYENHRKYERLFNIYKDIHDGIAPVYRKLADVLEQG